MKKGLSRGFVFIVPLWILPLYVSRVVVTVAVNGVRGVYVVLTLVQMFRRKSRESFFQPSRDIGIIWLPKPIRFRFMVLLVRQALCTGQCTVVYKNTEDSTEPSFSV